MTPEDYRRAGGLFEQLRGLSPDERQPLLEAACAGRPGLSDKIVRLLEADRKATAGAFPEQRALQDAAGLIGDSQSRANLEPAIASGARLGPYQILESIGRGGMGEVYRAQDPQLHRYVAVKVLSGALAGDTHYMDRFRHEARILASLNHPNIATVYGIEQGALVMELIEGENLRGPRPLEEATPVMRQIAIGLEAAHERGIVHRDLKPANIKITPEGVVKLLDFGLARSSSTIAREPLAAAGSEATTPVSSPHSPPLSTPPFNPGWDGARNSGLYVARASHEQAGGQAVGYLGLRRGFLRTADRTQALCRRNDCGNAGDRCSRRARLVRTACRNASADPPPDWALPAQRCDDKIAGCRRGARDPGRTSGV